MRREVLPVLYVNMLLPEFFFLIFQIKYNCIHFSVIAAALILQTEYCQVNDDNKNIYVQQNSF